ncbi:hypothetical protein G7066_14760 [Leucobacter coleopterorum]|uniref:Uncharacterized protein n=1 Tax=Leucobacter coleopterorum TaxID=2714933 RepID=A0ABX6JYX3_9MICO|nr:hypothetical protein [Leucobacter coleopterorum]QIM19524.1 hypothetical protein G7066_14760 [Leucobacter coleopterorum]
MVAGALVALLVVSGLQVGLHTSPAHAGANDFKLDVGSGGVTEVSGYADQISFETRVSPESGVPVKPGAITKITLDKSLRMVSVDALPANAVGATKVWDPQSNTLTVTWGELLAGTTFGVSISTTPSASATKTDTFQVTAVTTGFTPDGTPLSQTATSMPIAVTGSEIADGFSLAQPGDWELSSVPKVRLAPGGSTVSSVSLRQVGSKRTAFQDLQVETLWSEELSAGWATAGPRMEASGLFSTMTTVQDDSVARIYSYGVVGGGATLTAPLVFSIKVPAGTAPGTYSVPLNIVDNDPNGGGRRVIISSSLNVEVPEPEPAALTYSATYGPNQVAPGAAFDWGQRFNMELPSGLVKNLTVTLAVPEGVMPGGLSGAVSSGSGGSAGIKKAEYTSDSTVDGSANWQALPRNGTTITLADPSVITGIRYVFSDFSTSLNATYSNVVLSSKADDSLALGTRLPMVTQSVTFDDPVGGATSLDHAAQFDKTVTVTADPGGTPSIAASDTPRANNFQSFDQMYGNGSSFDSRFFVASTGSAIFHKPYIFMVAPKGMARTVTSLDVCSPFTLMQQHNGCNLGTPVSYPKVVSGSGAVPLSNGSTLFYSQVTEGELREGAAASRMQQLATLWNLNPKTMLAGKQSVLVGMGSLTDDFTVDAVRNQNARYTKKSLADDTSFGSFAGWVTRSGLHLQA